MILNEILTPNHCIVPLKANSKVAVLTEMVSYLEDKGELVTDSDDVIRMLLDREEQGSTGLGKGVAVPHARLETPGEVLCVLGVSPEGVDFDSLDGLPAHIFFLILVPSDKSGIHLQVLGDVAALAGKEEILQNLAQCKTPDEVYHLVTF